MFQNINSGYTLEPVTHILCLRQKKNIDKFQQFSCACQICSFIVYFFRFLFAQNKDCGYSLEPPQ